MIKNPYKYVGPLDPIKDKLVLVPKEDDLSNVISGIKAGDYWGIFGLRQSGKTTFLRQVSNRIKNADHVYINFEVSPGNEKNFYKWVVDEFKKQIPSPQEQELKDKWKEYMPEFRFVKFLEELKTKNDKKQIILLFDEIELIPSLEKFLRLWSNVFHQRNQVKQLKRYSVCITGSAELMSLIEGENSPFNIAKILYMKDFSKEESKQLIERPFKKLKIEISSEAKEKLITQIAGHPQLLQQALHFLLNASINNRKKISEKDIDNAVNDLLKANTTLDTLKNDLKNSKELKNLVSDILNGEEKTYHLYKEFSIKGAGPIIEGENSYCEIRNEVYKKMLTDFLHIGEPKFIKGRKRCSLI